MSAHHPPPPPPSPYRVRVDSRELRPKRSWYVVGASVIVLGLFVGVAGFLFMMFRALGLPDFAAELQGSGEAVFTVEADDPRIELYTSPADADESACSLVLPDGEEREFDSPAHSHSVEIGDESWSLVGEVPHDRAGEYTLACEGDARTVYAVAETRGGSELFGGVAGAIAMFVGVPFAGLVIGLSTLIITGVRRNRHKTRLLAERSRQSHKTAW